MQEQFREAMNLYPSSSMCDGRRVEVTPEMMMQRFEVVVSGSGEMVDEDKAMMRSILGSAFDRFEKARQSNKYEPEYWSGLDDDSTSDYDPEDGPLDEEDDDEYWDDDENMEDLDVGALKADMDDDVEMIRAALAGYHVGRQ